MTSRTRSVLGLAVVLFALLAVEALALQAGTIGLVLLGIVAGIALVTLLIRVSLERLAIGAALAAAFTLSWNGIFLGPERPGDLLVLLALVFVVMARPNNGLVTPPWWVKQLAAVVALVALIQILIPPDPNYLAHRLVLNAGGGFVGAGKAITYSQVVSSDLGVAFKFIVGVAAIPMVFSAVTLIERRAVRWLSIAWALGNAASGWAATADHFLHTSIGGLLTRLPNKSARTAGFSDHPNFLAAGLVLATPVAIYLLVSSNRWNRIFGAVALPGLLGGVLSSGSRGGAVTVVFAIFITVAVLPKTRVHLPSIIFVGGVGTGLVAGIFPAFGRKILKITRLAGNVTSAGSDQVRHIVGHQGVLDFQHSPIWGIDYRISTDASQVYLQELASGGLLLFTAMSLYSIGAMISAWALRTRDSLALALGCCVASMLALNFFEADLTDRFYYVPPAILAALMVAHRRGLLDPEPGSIDALAAAEERHQTDGTEAIAAADAVGAST
jgi:hypothetical protein